MAQRFLRQSDSYGTAIPMFSQMVASVEIQARCSYASIVSENGIYWRSRPDTLQEGAFCTVVVGYFVSCPIIPPPG
jgi:hypothetical protein